MINYSLSYRKVTVKNSAGQSVVAYKAYATARSQSTMNSEEFLDHQARKLTSLYTKADYRAILSQICMGIVDRCSDGVKVNTGEFGSFYPTISANAVENAEDFKPTVDIKKVYVNWSKGNRFKNFNNNTVKPQYRHILTEVNEASAVQANNIGLSSFTLHSTASKTAAFE